MSVPPPWLDDAKGCETGAASSGRWVKGQSGNPRGRPIGIVDKRIKLGERMMADADAILGVMIEKALDGDSSAAHLILGRVLPALRSAQEKVRFSFDATAPVTVQIEAVLTAIAAGALAPDVGREIIAALGTLADARATAELEARIVTLEARDVG